VIFLRVTCYVSVSIRGLYPPVCFPFTASGGRGSYSWSATGLPSGLIISGAGALSGTPVSGSQGSYNPQFTERDSSSKYGDGESGTDDQSHGITDHRSGVVALWHRWDGLCLCDLHGQRRDRQLRLVCHGTAEWVDHQLRQHVDFSSEFHGPVFKPTPFELAVNRAAVIVDITPLDSGRLNSHGRGRILR
jgi:putative Ig domain-containing protein